MTLFLIIFALAVAGLVVHLRSGGDLSDRDRRGWWPGSPR
jgi:hypothetical protein